MTPTNLKLPVRAVSRSAAAAGALALGALGLTALPANAVVEEDGTVTIDVLGITDFHGALAQAPAMAGLIDSIRAANEDTVFVSAGDNIGGSTYESAIQQDVPTIEVLNAMGLETSAVGNHEFDQGYDDLSGRVAGLADWEYLGANVEGEVPELEPFHVWTSPSGVTVGFVGTVTDETARLVSRDGIEGLSFTDEAAATNLYAAQLSDGDASNGEADIVVALSHAGATPDLIGGLSGDVDALFTGHTHVEVDDDAATFPVIQGGSAGDFLSRVTLSYDPAADAVVAAESTNIAIPVDGITADAEVQAIVDEAFAQADVLGQATLGTVTAPFNRGANLDAATGSNRGVESPLGNLLGEVAKWTAETRAGLEPDFGIINPGGIRADLDGNGDGIVTYAEAFTTQPFGNTIGTVDLTGAQVITMLEQQFQPDQDRPVLRLGLSDDIEYVYDPAAPQGEHITAVYIDGVPIDPAATYTVASNTFLLSGQDGFTVFTEGTNLTETGIIDLQGLVDYLAAHQDLAPDYAQRSVGVTGPSTAEAGTDITLELSSLVFTSTEPKPADVSVSLDGMVLVTAPIDPTVLSNVDESGTATATFTVPAQLEPGTYELVITTESGTEIAYPLEVTATSAPVPGSEAPGRGHTHPGKGDVPDHVKERWTEKAPRGPKS